VVGVYIVFDRPRRRSQQIAGPLCSTSPHSHRRGNCDLSQAFEVLNGRVARVSLAAAIMLTMLPYQWSRAQSDTPPQIAYERDIVFPDDLLLSTIDQIVREPGGNLYVVDRTSQSVHYFSPSGDLLHTLSIEACDPGRVFSPWWVSTNGEQVFVINGGPWGYLFDKNGACLGRVSEEYFPLRLQVSQNDRIVGLRRTADPNIPLVITSATLEGKTTGTWPLPIGEYPMANRRVETGGLAITGRATYYAVSSEPVIHRVDIEGNVTSIDVGDHFNHQRPTRDLPVGRLGPDLGKVAQLTRFATSNLGLFEVGDNLLLAQYRTGVDRWDRLWLSSDDGSVLWAETDTLGFDYVNGNLAFRVNQPDFRDDGSIPNPYLEVYTITR